MKRRTWLKAGGAALAALAPIPWVLELREAPRRDSLVPDPKGVLDLHPGLRYRVIQQVFAPMTDGFRVPARPDGMSCFAGPNQTWILMRNHELDYAAKLGAYRSGPPPEAYDKRAYGGVTRIVLDSRTLEVVSSNLALTGTLRNCAGGKSPWGWLSCEESTDPGHGYVFLCATTSEKLEKPRRIAGYGRFKHEAACVEPKSATAFLTEDRGDGCLYRFVPKDPSAPFQGKLQALRHRTEANYELSSRMAEDRTILVSWVDIDEPDPKDDTVRTQAQERGAAILSRGEGIWYHEGAVYICSTNGGRAGKGQIFRLNLKANDDTLELLSESPGEAVLDNPDNITVAPWGSVFMAEDGSGDQYIRALTPEGRVVDVARNARSGGELTGVCFSPDGSTLFFNLQHDGITVAVQGRLDQLTS